MPCLVALIAFSAPRVAIVLVVIFSDYIGNAYDGNLVPFLGFLFLPLTTLAYAFAQHNGGLSGFPMVLFVIAVLIDLGIIGGAKNAKDKRGG